MLARKSFLVIGAQFFTRFLGWFGLLILAKLWGGFAPEALGIIGFAMAFVSIFNIIGDLGFTQAHIKRISEGQDLSTCIGTFATIKILLNLLMVAVVLTSIFLWKTLLHGGFTDATTESIVYVFVIYYFFYNLQQITMVTFNGKGEIAKQQLTAVTENIVKVPLTIFVALAGVTIAGIAPLIIWPETLTPLQQFIATHAVGSQAMAYVFGMIASAIIGFWFLRKCPVKRPSMALAKNYFSFALPTLLISVLLILSANLDRIVIGFFWTSVEVGYYFSVQQIIQILLIISAAMTFVLFPAFSQFHSTADYGKIRETLAMAERYISMIMIPVIVVIIVFAKPIISIMLNSSFYPAISVLITLSIYTFIYTYMALHTSLITGVNKPKVAAKNGLIICLINIILDFLFVPQQGLLAPLGINGPTGAAIASSTAIFVGLVLLKISAKRLVHSTIIPLKTFLHILAGALMGLALYAVSTLVLINRWYTVLLVAAVGLLLYLGILSLMREFTKKDLRFFLNILHPREMYKYIKTEIKEESDEDRK